MSVDDLAINNYYIMRFNNLNAHEENQAVDYMRCGFSGKTIQYWKFLKKWSNKITSDVKNGLYKNNNLSIPVRLPSCSNENFDDYSIHLERLYSILWRRSFMDLFSAKHFNQLNNITDNNQLNQISTHDSIIKQDKKNKYYKLLMDPSKLNWDKSFDVTTLYGPNLSTDLSLDTMKISLRCNDDSLKTSATSNTLFFFKVLNNKEQARNEKSILKVKKQNSQNSHKSISVSFADNVIERRYLDRKVFCDVLISINDAYSCTLVTKKVTALLKQQTPLLK